jgi:hypothetical protein
MTSSDDPVESARDLAAAGGPHPTAWFERLYAAADAGEAAVPWDRGGAHPLIAEWFERRRPDGTGRRALVVGAGLGDDAELVAAHGFETIAFDVAPTAIETAQRRFPRSRVTYRTADLLDPPPEWRGAFDLVLESLTVQSMPPAYHAPAIAGVAGFVAAGGTLLVVATAAGEPFDGPPWPLTRAEVEAFAAGGELQPVEIESMPLPGEPEVRRWRAELARP